MEESVRGPDFTGHQVVQRQDVHWSMELQSLILPTLTKENIYSVLLRERQTRESNVLKCAPLRPTCGYVHLSPLEAHVKNQ